MSRGTMAKGFRVLMIDSETTWRGGENQLHLLMRGLREAGAAEVELAAPPDAAITRHAAEIGVPCLPLPIRGGMDLVAAQRLRHDLRRGRFDLVHVHASHAHSVAFLALVFSRLRRQRPPFLVVSRRVDFPFSRHGPSALKYRYGADLYLAISTGVRDVLVQCGVAPERIAMVPSGIDLARHQQLGETTRLRRELGLGNGAAVIGNVAALAPHKAQVDFVRAARLVADQVPEARF